MKILDAIEKCLVWFPVVTMAAFLILFAMAMNGNAWALAGWGVK